MGDTIEAVLRAQGKGARSREARAAAYRRADAAVNELGPFLFPLIADAETKVIGTRTIPKPAGGSNLRAQRYELHGVIDVVTQLELSAVPETNPLRVAIQSACGDLPDVFEVIVDYKGAPRPHLSSKYWVHGDWQVQTYAWLRSHQARNIPIVAGVLLYINELAPGNSDMLEIQRQLRSGETDVLPDPGSLDEKILRNWRTGQDTNQLSLGFRLRRAIRLVPVTTESLAVATNEFDNTVRQIEENIERESSMGAIPNAWRANCTDPDTCAACDFRHFCPTPGPNNVFQPLKPALAP